MLPDNMGLDRSARAIFADLGYDVSGEGAEFRATRAWRNVTVTAVSDPVDLPDHGTLRCFVTWRDRVEALERRLRSADPAYEWAIIGVGGDGEYEVACPPPMGPRTGA